MSESEVIEFVGDETVPDTLNVPSTINPSLILIKDESLELIVVPLNETSPVELIPVSSEPSPLNLVAVTAPVLGLYVKFPSDSSPTLPPSESAPATNVTTFSSFVLSLSVTVTVVATDAVPSKFATIVAVLESVTDVAVDVELESTALNLSSPSFQ